MANAVFDVNSFAIPAYTRPSLIFLMAVVASPSALAAGGNAIVRFMSNHSLALYCLHPFFVPLG